MSGDDIQGWTSIPVRPRVRDRVEAVKRPQESWGDTLDRLLDTYQEKATPSEDN